MEKDRYERYFSKFTSGMLKELFPPLEEVLQEVKNYSVEQAKNLLEKRIREIEYKIKITKEEINKLNAEYNANLNTINIYRQRFQETQVQSEKIELAWYILNLSQQTLNIKRKLDELDREKSRTYFEHSFLKSIYKSLQSLPSDLILDDKTIENVLERFGEILGEELKSSLSDIISEELGISKERASLLLNLTFSSVREYVEYSLKKKTIEGNKSSRSYDFLKIIPFVVFISVLFYLFGFSLFGMFILPPNLTTNYFYLLTILFLIGSGLFIYLYLNKIERSKKRI